MLSLTGFSIDRVPSLFKHTMRAKHSTYVSYANNSFLLTHYSLSHHYVYIMCAKCVRLTIYSIMRKRMLEAANFRGAQFLANANDDIFYRRYLATHSIK